MKKLTFAFMAMIGIIFCVGFTSCSGEDDDEAVTHLGFWLVTSVDDSTEAAKLEGLIIEFADAGYFYTSDTKPEEYSYERGWYYGRWDWVSPESSNSGSPSDLRIYVGNKSSSLIDMEYYMQGQVDCGRKTATFRYHWVKISYDGHGGFRTEWTDPVYHTMQLKRN